MKFQVLVQDRNLSLLPWRNILKLLIFTLLVVGIPVSGHTAKVTDFIPNDSIVYLKLQDIDEVYKEIQISEEWENILDQIMDESEMQEIEQVLLAAQAIIGTDLFGVIDTVGYQTGFALWKNEADTVQGGIVVHSGGNLAELKRLTKMLTGFIGFSGGTLKLDVGEHEKVKYSIVQLPDLLISYGFVGDFLVAGIGENSFKKLIDTYRKKNPSIRKNVSYSKVTKRFGEGQLSLSINVSEALPLLEDIDAEERVQLETFTNVYAKLNLLEAAPFLQFYAAFDSSLPENKIALFLKEGKDLETLKGLSGEEDLFIAVAPRILETTWLLIRDQINNNATDDLYALILFLEGMLNLNLEEDVMAGLTGEIALSVDDLTQFEPSALENLNIDFLETFQIDAASVHTHGGLIFNSANSQKWNQIGNSLSNLQNASISQTNYKGTKVSIFASNIYYTEKNGLSLLSFSEDQMYSIIDRLESKKKPSYLKQLPKKPLAVVKLNIAKLLESINGAVPIEDGIVKPKELPPLLAWITVKKNEAVLEATLSNKESPLEVLAKFAPIIAFHLKN